MMVVISLTTKLYKMEKTGVQTGRDELIASIKELLEQLTTSQIVSLSIAIDKALRQNENKK